MCVVSMVIDHYNDKWFERWQIPSTPDSLPSIFIAREDSVTRAEFEELKKDIAELKSLLVRAKKYDTETGQPDCETDEKMTLVRKVAEMVGVDLADVLKRA